MKTSHIEPLESRIAPASFISYIDADGDVVKITASTGTLDASLLVLSSPDPTIPAILKILELGGLDFDGANITFTVTKKIGGDGLADVGYIHASGTDLGNVTVKGDLGKIVSGDGDDTDGPSLKTLSVRSLGKQGLSTQTNTGDLASAINGHVVALKVSGDIKDAAFQVTGSIGSIAVGGSLVYGNLFASGDMGAVKIGHDILGAGTDNFGLVQSTAKLASITVGGAVLGGGGAYTGAIRAHDLGPVKIGHDLVGGTGNNSGQVSCEANGTMADVTIRGSVVGGFGDTSGSIIAGTIFIGTATAGKMTIGGFVHGGSGLRSGDIYSQTSMGAIKIGGDVIGGSELSSGDVLCGSTPGVFVGGSLVGGSGSNAGQLGLGEVAGSITIRGSVIAGSANSTGTVSFTGKSLTLGGSLIGGRYNVTSPNLVSETGAIFAFGTRAVIKIGGDVIGGQLTGDGELDGSGLIFGDDIVSITIGGSLIAGRNDGTGSLSSAGTITAKSIGSLTVKGSIIGNETFRASILVFGKPAADPSLALGSLTVGGRVENATIRALGDSSLISNTSNATIGTVKVAGDWIASSLASGVSPGNAFYGDFDDALVASAISRIASVTIGGSILGTSESAGGDHFGFVAHEIGAFKVAGKSLPLTAGVHDGPILFAYAGDVALREL